MVTVVTRAANGIPLTHDQVDSNFTGLADAVNNIGEDILIPAIAAKDAAEASATSAQLSATSAAGSANAASLSQGGAASSAEQAADSAAESAAYVDSLQPTSGASKVGAVDGSGGTLFTTVAGFIALVFSSAGSAFVGFLQAGVGAVRRSLESKSREVISALDYMSEAERQDVISCTGALDVGTACDKARDYVVSLGRKGKLVFPAGLYSRGTPWDFSYPGLNVKGDGVFSTVLKYTGSYIALRVDDSRPNNGAFAFTHTMSDFCVEGTGATQILLYLKNVNHVGWENINLREANSISGTAFRIDGSVAGNFTNITCSTNAQLMANRPLTGLVVDRDPDSGGRATDNVFTNLIIEGMMGDGVILDNSDQSLFLGGTSENNDGNGVTIAAGSRMNTFISVGFENRGFADIYDGGFSNKFINCYSNKMLYVDSSALMTRVDGGFYQNIEIAGDFATVQDLKYSFFAAGGAVNISANTSWRNLFNAQTSALTFPNKSTQNVTLTGSPFTYVNTSGMNEDVIVSGGTVTQNIFNRSGSAVLPLPVSGMWAISPGDGLTLSYSIAPTVVRVPHGTNYG